MAILVIRCPGQGEETVTLPQEEARVGRLQGNAIVVDHHSVSRLHAVISPSGEGHLLRDMGSKNGTWVNGQRVSGQPVHLHTGDHISLGPRGVEMRYFTDEGTVTEAFDLPLGSWVNALGLGEPWAESKRWLRVIRVTPWLRLASAVIGILAGLLGLAWWIIRFTQG